MQNESKTKRRCVCPSEDPRACYCLRYYGIAGVGEPSRDEDDGECTCACHDEAEPEDYEK